jgi:hypothetical protein
LSFSISIATPEESPSDVLKNSSFNLAKGLLAPVLLFTLCGSVAVAQSEQQPPAPAQSAAAPNQRRVLNHTSRHATMYYESMWGVDSLRVKLAESGELVRFNYRVLDPEKAAALNDKKAEPELYDAEAGVKLVVPQMEKVGKLRQSSTPKAGMTYWMAFSNPTRVVKRGHRVDVVIGSFRANNLVVE